jgi:DNA-binding CsgD family transcriptional regulator
MSGEGGLSPATCAALAEASTAGDVGVALVRAVRERLGVNAMNFFPVSRRLVAPDQHIVHHDCHTREEINDDFVDNLPRQQRELLSWEEIFEASASVLSLRRLFGQDFIRRTDTYQDFFRKHDFEYMTLATFRAAGQPLAFAAITRGRQQSPFDDEELRWFDGARALAERSLLTVERLGTGESTRAAILDALSRGLPRPALLFDAEGKMSWLNDAAAQRFFPRRIEVMSTQLLRHTAALDAFAEMSRQALRGGPLSVTPAREVSSRVVRRGEQVLVKRLRARKGEGERVLLVVEPLMRADHVLPRAETLRRQGLAARETEVALLAAQGFTGANIAARLGLSEQTVRTHLKHIYQKLSVSSRSELLFELLALAQGTRGPGPP